MCECLFVIDAALIFSREDMVVNCCQGLDDDSAGWRLSLPYLCKVHQEPVLVQSHKLYEDPQ